jgi:surface antigen
MRNASRLPGNPFECAGDKYRNPLPRSLPSRSLTFLLAAIATATAISSCSVTKTMTLDTAQSETVTASIAAPMKAEGIDGTDAELIRSAIAGNIDGDSNIAALAWSNPDTGNSGTITGVDEFVGEGGRNCRKFRTTVDSFVGISQYSGEACETTPGSWELSSLDRN